MEASEAHKSRLEFVETQNFIIQLCLLLIYTSFIILVLIHNFDADTTLKTDSFFKNKIKEITFTIFWFRYVLLKRSIIVWS